MHIVHIIAKTHAEEVAESMGSLMDKRRGHTNILQTGIEAQILSSTMSDTDKFFFHL